MKKLLAVTVLGAFMALSVASFAEETTGAAVKEKAAVVKTTKKAHKKSVKKSVKKEVKTTTEAATK